MWRDLTQSPPNSNNNNPKITENLSQLCNLIGGVFNDFHLVLWSFQEREKNATNFFRNRSVVIIAVLTDKIFSFPHMIERAGKLVITGNL